MKITNVETFRIRVPIPQEEVDEGRIRNFSMLRISTDDGITGYGFAGIDGSALENTVKPMLLGNAPFAVERYLLFSLASQVGLFLGSSTCPHCPTFH